MNELKIDKSVKHGSVEIRLDSETDAFVESVIQAVPDFGVLLTLDWEETWSLFKVCQYVFEDPAKFDEMYISPHLWNKTRFHFMAPLCDRRNLFWFSCGPLNCWVPTERMREVFADLKTALDLAGGLERFMPDTHN